MVKTYRNNRLVPAVIIAICIVLVYCLLDVPYTLPHTNVRGSANAAYNAVSKPKQDIPHKENPTIQQLPVDSVKSAPQATNTPFISDGGSGGSAVGDKSSGGDKKNSVDGALDSQDVLLMVKTGGTTLWKRLLIHLSTSLDPQRINHENVVIYSDYPEKVGAFTVIDTLANMTQEAKSKPDFAVYRQQPQYEAHNYYVEAAGIEGDEWGPVGGWIIDKYKFVPLVEHAGTNWPRAKWYIYMEDDAYLFLPNVLSYLAKFDWKKPHYLGHYSGKSDVIFAHGGAGFAMSRGAWEKSFGSSSSKESFTEKYYQYTADHCCGDQVLGHALKEHGITFGENGGDGKFTWGFNAIVHWAFAFERSNWCQPVLSWHKVHARDVARYYDLERSWDFKTKGPLLYRDFFNHLILPNIKKNAEWWENLSGVFQISSANKDTPPAPEDKHSYNPKVWNKAWESAEACEAACKSWLQCVQWSFVEDLCKMDDKMIMGQGYAPSMSQRKTSLQHTSGWLPERLDAWKC